MVMFILLVILSHSQVLEPPHPLQAHPVLKFHNHNLDFLLNLIKILRMRIVMTIKTWTTQHAMVEAATASLIEIIIIVIILIYDDDDDDDDDDGDDDVGTYGEN